MTETERELLERRFRTLKPVWTPEDDRIVEEHKKRVAEGKEKFIDITNMPMEEFRNLSLDDPRWACANCRCHDYDSLPCECLCHKGAQAD